MQKFNIDCGMDMDNPKVFVFYMKGKRGINYNHLVLLFNGEVFNKAVRGYKGYATTKCPIKIITELDEDDDMLTIEWRYNCLDIKSIQDAKVFIKFVYLCKRFLKNIRTGRSSILPFFFLRRLPKNENQISKIRYAEFEIAKSFKFSK